MNNPWTLPLVAVIIWGGVLALLLSGIIWCILKGVSVLRRRFDQ